MGRAENNKIIEKAFQDFAKRKDEHCLKALSDYMKKATEMAMNLHDVIWGEDGKKHIYHSISIRDEFGWAVSHNGVVMEMGMQNGGKITGRYSDLFNALSSSDSNGWVGHIVSIIEPIELRNGHILHYKREFEEYVFDEIYNLTEQTFLETFKASATTIKK